MKIKLISVALISSLVILMLAGCTVSVSVTPSKSLSVSDAVTCKSLDSDKKPVDITNTFDAGVKGIYLSLVIHNFTTKDKITVKWNYLDTNEVVNTIDFTSPQDLEANYLGFSISFDQGFPAGKYNAEIYLNDKLTETVNFSVK
jgi:hypothetical protein